MYICNMNYNRINKPLLDFSQSPKNCKKRTPDYVDAHPKKGRKQVGFKSGDNISFNDKLDLLGNTVPTSNELIFDSYDSYDNTAYIKKDRVTMTYLVELKDIELVFAN